MDFTLAWQIYDKAVKNCYKKNFHFRAGSGCFQVCFSATTPLLHPALPPISVVLHRNLSHFPPLLNSNCRPIQ